MRWRRHLPVLAAYFSAAVVITWPLAVHLTDRIGAPQGPGEPFLNLWILGWGLRAWTTDPAGVFSGRVFDANIFFPAENTLAYSDHFLLQSLALSPVYAATGNVVLCYNLLVILSIALSGWAMHAFVRAVTGSARGALLAGLAWACWPYRTAHLLQIQLHALYFIPLALLCVHRLVAGRRWRDVLALGSLTALQTIASISYGVMTAVVVVASGAMLALATGQWRSGRLWLRFVVAGVTALVCAAPLLWPYVRSQQSQGFGQTPSEASQHSAGPRSYVQVPPTNLVYGRTVLAPSPSSPDTRDRSGVEHYLFPGFVLTALALFGMWRNWNRDSRPLVLSSLALIVAGVVLSGGPEGVRGLYALLHDNVFGFRAIRAPARLSVIAMLGLATLAALGLRQLPGSRPGSVLGFSAARRISTILVAAALLEYVNSPLPLAPAPPRSTPVAAWLKTAPEPGAVVHLPLTMDIENTPFMVQSLEHGRPIVNGYSGQRPDFYPALVNALADIPSTEAFLTLKELDVRFVVSGTSIGGAGNPRSPLVERARLNDGIIYELRWTPEAEASLEDVIAEPPPPPGVPPFEAGERAVYEVHWDGGPLNLAAGRASLRVIDGESGGDRWEFEALAETADWVSSFFEARDRFVTTANRELQPIEHTREVREGRRSLDRTYVFDREARVVRMGETPGQARQPEAVALPLGVPATRDALTALYYARTLRLQPGAIITVPINEAGSALLLQVSVADKETIEVGGNTYRAIRVEPRLTRRIERRRPVTLTIWLSDDERRLPLRATIEAGFGRVRADLVDYTR
jgi:Protein of unknown function (DUF3108)